MQGAVLAPDMVTEANCPTGEDALSEPRAPGICWILEPRPMVASRGVQRASELGMSCLTCKCIMSGTTTGVGRLLWGGQVPAADVLDCPLVSPAQATHKLVWGRPQEVCVKGKIEPRISV